MWGTAQVHELYAWRYCAGPYWAWKETQSPMPSIAGHKFCSLRFIHQGLADEVKHCVNVDAPEGVISCLLKCMTRPFNGKWITGGVMSLRLNTECPQNWEEMSQWNSKPKGKGAGIQRSWNARGKRMNQTQRHAQQQQLRKRRWLQRESLSRMKKGLWNP